jgi:hypothetical protein
MLTLIIFVFGSWIIAASQSAKDRQDILAACETGENTAEECNELRKAFESFSSSETNDPNEQSTDSPNGKSATDTLTQTEQDFCDQVIKCTEKPSEVCSEVLKLVETCKLPDASEKSLCISISKCDTGTGTENLSIGTPTVTTSELIVTTSELIVTTSELIEGVITVSSQSAGPESTDLDDPPVQI